MPHSWRRQSCALAVRRCVELCTHELYAVAGLRAMLAEDDRQKRQVVRGTYRRIKPISQCDSTAIRLRYDYDEKLTCSFFACVKSRQMEAGARDTS